MKSIFNENCVITSAAIFLLELLCHIYNSPPIASHLSNSNKALHCNSSIQDLNYQFQNKSRHSKGKAGFFHCLETVEEDRFTYKFSLLIHSMLLSLWEKQFLDCLTNLFILLKFAKVTIKLYCYLGLAAALTMVLAMVPGLCDCSHAAQCCRLVFNTTIQLFNQNILADPNGNSFYFSEDLTLHAVRKECFARHEDIILQNKR